MLKMSRKNIALHWKCSISLPCTKQSIPFLALLGIFSPCNKQFNSCIHTGLVAKWFSFSLCSKSNSFWVLIGVEYDVEIVKSLHLVFCRCNSLTSQRICFLLWKESSESIFAAILKMGSMQTHIGYFIKNVL